MTLEEMLALLPDNTVGAIAAADLRTIVTGLFDYVETQDGRITIHDGRIATLEEAVLALQRALTDHAGEVEGLEARIAALEAQGSGGGGGGGSTHPSISGSWQINPQAGQVPGGKQMTTNTGLVSTATWLRFDRFDLNDTDMTQALMTVDHIFMQQKSNSSNWARLTVNGAATTVNSYVQIPVTGFEGAGSVIPAAWQTAVVALGFDS